MKGRYPVCCLFLELDPAAVDVNIHPAKKEVKFHRESEVRRLVAQAVQKTLLSFHSEGATTHAPVQAPARPPSSANLPADQSPQLDLRPTASPAAATPSVPSLPRTGSAIPERPL